MAKFPHLSPDNIDYGTTEFPKENGEYNTILVFDNATSMQLIEQLEPLLQEAQDEAEAAFAELPVKSRKKLGSVTMMQPFSPVYDENENETGEFEFRFKTSYSGEDKKTGNTWKRTLPIFDAFRQPVDAKKLKIYGGSKLRVAFSPSPYFVSGSGQAGLTLYLDAVQIIELSSFTRSAEDFGFEEETEGFGFDPDEYADDSAEDAASDEEKESSDSAEDEADF